MLRKWFIEKLGGYATIDDAIEAIRKHNLKERQTILTMAVKRLFNTIGPDDILKEGPDKEWLLEGKTLSKGQVDILKAEAAQLESMLLWKVLKKDIFYQANRKMYTLAENDLHVVTAKFWMYTFDAMKTRIESIAAGSAQFNRKNK